MDVFAQQAHLWWSLAISADWKLVREKVGTSAFLSEDENTDILAAQHTKYLIT